MTLLLYLGLMLFGGLVAAGVGAWASRGGAVRRNATALTFSTIASYAAGFLIDMLVSAWAGEIPPAHVVAPSFSWFAIFAATSIAALTTQAASLALWGPFAANALLALLATAVHPRHILVSVALIVLAGLIAFAQRHVRKLERKGEKVSGSFLPNQNEK
jgi:hypothetical protein